MSHGWAPPSVGAAPTAPRSRSVWTWTAFGLGLTGGLLTAPATLFLAAVWEIGCRWPGADGVCGSAWLVVLGGISGAAIVAPIVGVIVADERRRPMEYWIAAAMIAPSVAWVVTLLVLAV